MPRKQPEAPRKQASTANDDDATQSYLDNFLQSEFGEKNIPFARTRRAPPEPP